MIERLIKGGVHGLFILGTSAVLALVPQNQLDLIAPIPQVLAVGFHPLGIALPIASLAILALLCIRVGQSSVMFAGNTRLPMVAGWDRLLPESFTRLHPRYRTPVYSILLVGAATLVLTRVSNRPWALICVPADPAPSDPPQR